MFLVQLYPSHMQRNIPVLLPLMKAAIEVQGPNPVPPAVKGAYNDLKTAQVKTVSFLIFVLRASADYLRPHQQELATAIVALVKSCPGIVAVRKELLVAIRHVLTTDLRQGFFRCIPPPHRSFLPCWLRQRHSPRTLTPAGSHTDSCPWTPTPGSHLDTLMDESVLIGPDPACKEALCPLAYSLLAELVNHIRKELSSAQLSRVIYIFSCNMNDPSLFISVQATCVRLMINLVETLYSRRSTEGQVNEVGATPACSLTLPLCHPAAICLTCTETLTRLVSPLCHPLLGRAAACC